VVADVTVVFDHDVVALVAVVVVQRRIVVFAIVVLRVVVVGTDCVTVKVVGVT